MLWLGIGCVLFGSSIDFKTAPKNPSHIMPHSPNEVLSFSSILEPAINSVVNIATKQVVTNSVSPLLEDPFFRHFFGPEFYRQAPTQRAQRALGSGVILSSDGYIVTNHHVIDGADEITVTLSNSDKEYVAKLIGSDSGSDLALIKIEAKNLQPIVLGNIGDVRVGDIVFAIGNPFGVGESVTQGIVSALGKNAIGINRYENFIQTDASINPGNSGGALVDSRGVLIGINTAILSRSGGNHGIGFSIPVDMMQNIVSQLAQSGKVSRGYLGVNLSSLTPELKQLYKETKGAVVTNVQLDSVADKAGIQRGDLIIKVDNSAIDSPLTLQRVIGEKEPNSKIRITLERNKKKEVITLTLGSQDDVLEASSSETAMQGATLSMLTPQLRSQLGLSADSSGVVVTQVEPNSQAQKDGFQAGDVIIQIENKTITSIKDLRQALAPKKPKRVYLSRGGAIMLLVVN